MNPVIAIHLFIFFLILLSAELVLFRDNGGRIIKERRFILAGLCFLVSFVVYIQTLAPGIVGDDTAEYALQVRQNGLMHGMGYPFYLALGKLFCLPFGGNTAYGLNLMSAFFSALAVMCLSLLIIRLKMNDRLAFYIPLHFAFVPELWFQATKASPRNLSTAFTLLILLGLLRWQDQKQKTSGVILLALCAGLLSGVYFPSILIAPALGAFVFFSPGSNGRARWERLIQAAVFYGAGLLITFFITALLARVAPPMGTVYPPAGPRSFWYAITGKEWHMGYVGFVKMAVNWGKLFKYTFLSFLGIGFIAGLIGLVASLRRFPLSTWLFLILCGPFAALYVYSTQTHDWYASFGQTNTFYAFLMIWSAAGYSVLLQRGVLKSTIRAVTFLLPLLALGLFWSKSVPGIPAFAAQVDKSSDHEWENFAYGILNPLPPHSIVFTGWTEHTSIRYIQATMNQRPDVTAFEWRDGMRYGKTLIPSWRQYIAQNYKSKPVFLTKFYSPPILESTELIRFRDNLWRVVEQTPPPGDR